MNRFLKTTSLLLVLGTLALAAAPLTPDALIKDAAKHNGKVVTASGSVLDFKQKTSKKGRPYFTFKLKGSKESVSVYGKGTMTPALKDGDRAEATGVFRKEKKILDFTVRNEIDVTPEKGKKLGVRVLKRAK